MSEFCRFVAPDHSVVDLGFCVDPAACRHCVRVNGGPVKSLTGREIVAWFYKHGRTAPPHFAATEAEIECIQ